MTLLEMTQGILSSLDSDEVNSISDTPEATQVANVIKTVYNDIISRANLPEHFDVFELDAAGDPTRPTIMYVPANVQNILWVKYDKRQAFATESDFQQVQFLPIAEFFDRMHGLNNQNQTDVEIFSISSPNSSTFEIKCLNNKYPDYYTCYDDNLVLFDSYDANVDTTLQKNKTICYGEFEPTFSFTDSFVPNLDSRQFSLLYNEAKAMCFAELKQIENARAERNAKRGWVTLGHQKNTLPADYPFFNKLPNFGKRRR